MKLSLLVMGTLGLGLFVGCAKTTMAGAGVHVAKDRAEVNGCQPISAVDATQSSQEKAETELRNDAGRMNANWVLITDTVENGGYVSLKGTAYNCSNDAATRAKAEAETSSEM